MTITVFLYFSLNINFVRNICPRVLHCVKLKNHTQDKHGRAYLHERSSCYSKQGIDLHFCECYMYIRNKKNGYTLLLYCHRVYQYHFWTVSQPIDLVNVEFFCYTIKRKWEPFSNIALCSWIECKYFLGSTGADDRDSKKYILQIIKFRFILQSQVADCSMGSLYTQRF